MTVGLSNLARSPGVIAALVLDRGGSVLEGSASEEVDLRRLAALARDMLMIAGGMGTKTSFGSPHSLFVDFEKGPVAIWPVGADAALVLLGDRRCVLGRARLEGGRAVASMSDALVLEAHAAIQLPVPRGRPVPAEQARPRRRSTFALIPVVFGLLAVVATATVPREHSPLDRVLPPSQTSANQQPPFPTPAVLILPITLPPTVRAGPTGLAVRIAITPPVPGEVLDASRQYLRGILRSLVTSLPPEWVPDPDGVALLRRAIQEAVPASVAPLLPTGTQVTAEMIVKVSQANQRSP